MRSSSTRTEGQEKFSKVGDKVASGMQSTADWLRSADMQSIQQSVERQVRENPGRTLLVALGLGYVLGKVLGGNKET